jgi:hypothetical protein
MKHGEFKQKEAKGTRGLRNWVLVGNGVLADQVSALAGQPLLLKIPLAVLPESTAATRWRPKGVTAKDPKANDPSGSPLGRPFRESGTNGEHNFSGIAPP